MEHKIIKLSTDDLDNGIKERLSFWADPSLLAVYAKRDSLNFYYLCATKNDTISAVVPIFEKRKYGIRYIYQPSIYFYTPIDLFMDENLSLFQKQNEQLKIFKAFATYLKKQYIKVTLSFDTEIADIRAFQWGGFKVEPMFTYKKRISEYDREHLPSISKDKLKKANKSSLNIKVCWDTDIISHLLKDLCNRKHLSSYLLEKNYLVFMEELYGLGMCTKLVVYKEEKPLAYWAILKDSKKKTLYSLSLASNDLGNVLGAHALCVDYIMNNYSDFDTYDFCGANVESVAYFKSQFNCDLVNYFRITKKYLA